MPRWLPLVTTALVAIVAVIGIGLWVSNARDQRRAENGGKPAIPACEPQNTVGKVILPDCPSPAFPTPRTP
ncbi:hypothetical protein [Methylobacterium oxalidis]|uniref:Molecular chaperone-like protein n=1 Tax=Methylobacterium oxalidis TaxID=944322 RepID=A0A512J0U8_9HYPH|nr:hypothetical protein [Methylobacterium oxalidis]GEP03601.1 hypothetical protein MOX02_16390 [Methylobacterium oxalidis]GJE34306.1 hypothetical protein LDDCCGHA_4517 [Methylobacterium oxalidis]GLS64928.1 hypothetical protein GCM10007888_33090 [Methylobacterium oxalidis]